MATKKSSTKKAPTTKKPAARKAAAKKNTANPLSLRSQVGLRSEDTEFMTFRITKQTLYWLVLGAVVILFTLWLSKLQSDIQTLYDQIDATSIETSLL
jgi:hypothetical protein